MHIADVKIPSTWTALSTLTTVDDTSTYQIVNNSPDDLYFVEGDTTPTEAIIGVIVAPGNYVMYKKGSQANLYIKNGYAPVVSGGVDTQNKISNITINKVG